MNKTITLSKYIADTVKTLAKIFYQDIFIVDGFTYLDNQTDMIVSYRINGKRSPILQIHLTQLIKDRQMLNCFSRNDVSEIGMLYGRLIEKIIQKRQI
ncbi:MAG: hypothetical protein JO131_04395 [Gammaproteobacteria bacterium]|nr:hypothetical protein [Gammaproteobacteria bacterium]